jgi:hypothetical protein
MPENFFNIEMLPARHGDCLWVEYGDKNDIYRMLIDGGPVSTFDYIQARLDQTPVGQRGFELVVLTHVDADHVEGLVRLFAEQPLPLAVDDVWFNGWRQMKASHGLLGPLQGEFLSSLLVRRVPNAWKASASPWVVPKQGTLPVYTLGSGMKLTLLSPDPGRLMKMMKKWEATIVKAGILPGDLDAAWKILAQKKKFLPKKGLLGTAPDLDALLRKQFLTDQAVPNGSSIAFLAEYRDKTVLFLGDAHPGVVAASIRRLCQERGTNRLEVDAVKVAHHGSKSNTSAALLKLIRSPRYLISTNGDQFKHPDKECLARIVKYGKPEELYFNYQSKYTKPWIGQTAEESFHYKSIARTADAVSLNVVL